MRIPVWMAAAMAAGLALMAAPGTALAQAPANGEQVYNTRCKGCHEPPVERAPNRTALAAMPSAQVMEALTNGIMKPMTAGLTDADRQAVTAYLSAGAGPAAGAPRAAPVGVDTMCATHPPIRETGQDWTSVGVDTQSRRYQKAPGLSLADLPRLKVKWAFAMPGGGMPTVIGDWLFVTNRSGKLYALDAKTGCVHWTVAGVVSRTTPMVVKSPVSPSGWATFIGEANRTVRAFDAQTGKVLWRSAELDPNPVAGITGSPVVAGGQLVVPLTSLEEVAGDRPDYPCCSFRGSLAALDLSTGKTNWQTHVITEPLRPTHRNSAGTQLQGPAGGAVWSAPTVDLKRGLVYAATGDSYTDAPTKGADAIVAMELASGRIRWSHQVTAGDNFIVGCMNPEKTANCPSPDGPDFDFGASPILFHLKGGKDVLLAGQKSGLVYGLNPDTGKRLWTTRVGAGSVLGGVEWGMAADDKHLFVAISDVINLIDEIMRPKGKGVTPKPQPKGKPGLSALDPATGRIVWHTPAPVAPCHYAGDRSRDRAEGACIRAQSAAPSAMPGAVISGTMDGWLRAYDAATGKILWAYSTTAQTYDTVNGVKGQPGGNLDGLGAAIAGGMVYTLSGVGGAANTGSNPVNVLLAFSVDGR